MTAHISKVDANQGDIVAALRKVGCEVLSLAAVGKGCPDLLVFYGGVSYRAHDSHLFLLEVKSAKGKLTPDQVEFHRDWPVIVVHNELEALRAVGAIGEDSEM